MDALYLFKQVAIAVSEYHELNLAHGNINFNNILLTNSFIKLTDILKINRDELFPP
jgi:serine/threonine protein kinase